MPVLPQKFTEVGAHIILLLMRAFDTALGLLNRFP
jgi:hypothetical protein